MKNVIIGVGNPEQGDDAVGLCVTKEIRTQCPEKVITVDQMNAGKLADLWKDADSVVLVDAMESGADPGTIRRIDPHDDNFGCIHCDAVKEAIETSKILRQLPKYFVIYGIEGKTYKHRKHLTREVRKAVHEVRDLALHEFLGCV